MVYQLAKTSPLITGQVKMDMVMNGNTVVELQYSPISDNIPFNHNNPEDVLNYTHGENIKILYNRIQGDFHANATNPELSIDTLHRYDTLCDDTHESTYEMGMKRMEFQRYNKQFSFFCPFWCDNTEEFNNIHFEIALANNKGRILYSKEIVFSDAIKKYLDNIFPSLGYDTPENTDLVYINFETSKSHIKGINATVGNVQTVDTSYIVNNLLYQERPVMETDNMIVNLFSQNNIVCTQLFNFNFVFDMSDLLPITLLNDFLYRRVNVFVNIYLNKDGVRSAVPVKDIYSNYDFIPRYDIYTGKYENNNVFDYLNDEKTVELIAKNKLAQSTFHWCLRDNQRSMFNLYNGFAPTNNKDVNCCTSISNDAHDMFTNDWDENNNPLGIFKYTLNEDTVAKFMAVNKLSTFFDNDDNFYTLDISEDFLNSKDYQWFGNVLLSNEKIKQYLETEKKKFDLIAIRRNTEKDKNNTNLIEQQSDYMLFVNANALNIKHDDYNGTYKFNTNDVTYDLFSNDIKQIKCAFIKTNSRINYRILRTALSQEVLLTEMEYVVEDKDAESEDGEKTYRAYNSNSSYLALMRKDSALYLVGFTRNEDAALRENISFYNLYTKNFIADFANIKDRGYTEEITDGDVITNAGFTAEQTVSQISINTDSPITGFDSMQITNSVAQTAFSSGRSRNYVVSNNRVRTPDGNTYSSIRPSNVIIDNNPNITPNTSSKDYNITFSGYPYSDSDAQYKLVAENAENAQITQKRLIYNVLNVVAAAIKCAKLPNYIVLDRSFNTQRIKDMPEKCEELEMTKIDKTVNLYRYDSNLMPFFIDLDDKTFYNMTFWCKQYDNTILKTQQMNLKNGFYKNEDNVINYGENSDTYTIKTTNGKRRFAKIRRTTEENEMIYEEVTDNDLIDALLHKWNEQYKESYQFPDNVSEYAQYAATGLKPRYKSLGYYVLKTIDVDVPKIQYDTFYMDEWDNANDVKYNYQKEKSWYKNNSFIYLLDAFEDEIIMPSGEDITKTQIVECITKTIKNAIHIDETDIDEKTRIENLIVHYISGLYEYTFTYDYYVPTPEELVALGYKRTYKPSPIEFQKYEIKFILK